MVPPFDESAVFLIVEMEFKKEVEQKSQGTWSQRMWNGSTNLGLLGGHVRIQRGVYGHWHSLDNWKVVWKLVAWQSKSKLGCYMFYIVEKYFFILTRKYLHLHP